MAEENIIVRLALEARNYVTGAARAAKATRSLAREAAGVEKQGNKAARALDKMGKLFPGIRRNVNALGSDFGRVFGVRAVARITKDFIGGIITASSDLVESINAVEKIFGSASATIFEFGETSATAVGLAAQDFQQLSTVTGALLKTFITDVDAVAAETVKLTQRASDLASVFNTDVDEALLAIQASIRGQQRPIRRFGVSMDEAAVKARALKLGLAATTGELTLQDRAVARLDILYEQTTASVGDFQDTIGDLANASRVAAAAWKDAQADLGEAITPAATAAVVKFSEALLGVNRASLLIRQRAFDLKTAGKGYVDFADIALGPIINIGDAMSDFDQQTSNGIDRAIEYIDAVNAGTEPTIALVDAIDKLSGAGDVTEVSMATLASAIGVGVEETGAAIETILDQADAYHLTGEEAEALQAILEILFGAGLATDAEKLAEASHILRFGLEGAGGAAGDAAGDTDDFTEAVEEAIEASKKAKISFDKQAASILGVARAQKEATSPIFALLGANERLLEAQLKIVEVAEDKESTDLDAQSALVDLLSAQQDLEVATEEAAGSTSTATQGLLDLGENAGAVTEEVQALIDTLFGLPTSIETDVTVLFRQIERATAPTPAPTPRTTPPPPTGIPEGLSRNQQFGGNVEAFEPVTVGEGGPERFIPLQPGRIETGPAGATGGGGDTNITLVLEGSGGDAFDDVQLALSMIGITEIIEFGGDSTLRG